MKKLTPIQMETLEFCKKQIDEARRQDIDISKVKKRDLTATNKILEDNTGIGTSLGAFPSKVKILNY